METQAFIEVAVALLSRVRPLCLPCGGTGLPFQLGGRGMFELIPSSSSIHPVFL